VKREVIIFAIALAALMVALKFLESAFILGNYELEFYISMVALVFLAFGLWFGKRDRSAKVSVEFDPELIGEVKSKLQISDREHEVIVGIADGLSNKEIGERLHLSEHTVKSHLANVFAKLNAKRRTEVLLIARKEGLIA
jgi:DNA-binding CsgD family transcriptional regulator